VAVSFWKGYARAVWTDRDYVERVYCWVRHGVIISQLNKG